MLCDHFEGGKQNKNTVFTTFNQSAIIYSGVVTTGYTGLHIQAWWLHTLKQWLLRLGAGVPDFLGLISVTHGQVAPKVIRL